MYEKEWKCVGKRRGVTRGREQGGSMYMLQHTCGVWRKPSSVSSRNGTQDRPAQHMLFPTLATSPKVLKQNKIKKRCYISVMFTESSILDISFFLKIFFSIHAWFFCGLEMTSQVTLLMIFSCFCSTKFDIDSEILSVCQSLWIFFYCVLCFSFFSLINSL